jgi:hypothetical protein
MHALVVPLLGQSPVDDGGHLLHEESLNLVQTDDKDIL